jgi:formate dehydrogenase iron-sulfur subunit
VGGIPLAQGVTPTPQPRGTWAFAEARLYGEDPGDGVGGDGAFFLLLDEPEVYGLPPDPVVTTRDLPSMWRHAGAAAAGLVAAVATAFAAEWFGRH